jgi:hypothetical protein
MCFYSLLCVVDPSFPTLDFGIGKLEIHDMWCWLKFFDIRIKKFAQSIHTHLWPMTSWSKPEKTHELKVKFIEVWTYKLTLVIVVQINKGCKQNILNIFVTFFLVENNKKIVF